MKLRVGRLRIAAYFRGEMPTRFRVIFSLVVAAFMCLPAVALPTRPRPPVPKPKRPDNSHLLQKANAGKSALLANARKNRNSSALLLQASRHHNANPPKRPPFPNSNTSAHQHALLKQANHSSHNFLTARNNARPNQKNHLLLLQQQKNAISAHPSRRAKRIKTTTWSTQGGTPEAENPKDDAGGQTPPLKVEDPLKDGK